jgi:nitroreductase
MNWMQLIGRRISVRQFEPELDEATLARVRDICAPSENLNSCPLELRLLPGTQVHQVLRGFGGRYGRIVAPWYIAAIAEGGQDSLLNMGYRAERAVLEITALGLGTCWIGGLYDKSSLNESLNLSDAGVRALIALGRPGKETWNRGIKLAVGQRRRLPLEKIAVFDSDQAFWKFPWRTVVEAVRWAPSAINRQPWRLWFTSQGVHVFSASSWVTRGYTPTDIGIAICHLELACKQLSIPGSLMQTEHPHRKGWEYWLSYVID